MGLLVTKAILCLTMVGAGGAVIWAARAAASGRLKRNFIAGIRTRSTLASDEAWLAAHQAARSLTELGGWSSIATGVLILLASTDAQLGVITIAGSVVLLVLVIAGAYRGVRAISGERPDQAS